MTRKHHVRVPQHAYLEAAREVGEASVDGFAKHLGVSTVTARRRLDGLVAQGLLERRPNGRRARTYAPPAPAAALQADTFAGLRDAIARLEAVEAAR